MPGDWDAPITAPFNVGLMLLLTDGSVLAQNVGTSLWWRLRPDRAGRYSFGEWKPTGSSSSAPLYFASAVLGDGNVFVAGGEYSNNANTPSDLCTAERYDPVTESWTSLPTPPGWTAIGDAPCCVLNDGRLLLGNINAGVCAIWDPTAHIWSATAPKANGSSSEETWTLLPDGSVLTLDCVGQPASERFLGDTWTPNGSTPDALVEAASIEIGPAVLLPDGSVFALGATGATARFVPNDDRASPGTWSAGPDIPQGAAGVVLGAKDAPACLLPNGRVLAAVGPVDGTKINYLGPTTFFEFDPTGAGAWSPPLPPPPEPSALAPYNFTFLLLPNGQVLVANGTQTIQVYQPDGAPDPSWAPTIQTCPATAQAGSVFRLQGTQLNGLSQACAYGDDAAMATNYPIVRLRAAAPSDTVVYCRTFEHSTMGVATGRSLQSTQVLVPANLDPGNYMISVVANGIASPERAVTITPASSTARASLASRARASAEPQIFGEEEVFLRDLSEVHLLIDFISGRADKSLVGLTGVASISSDGATAGPMSPQQVVEEICKITYPPDGSLEATAQQAALIMVVKDKLNYLAAPSRGMTVAFTSMMAGVAKSRRWSRFLTQWVLAKGRTTDRPRERLLLSSDAPSADNFFSATQAYPNLEPQAQSFRRFYRMLPWMAGLLVLLIVYLNWDVGVTGATLKQLSGAEAAYSKQFPLSVASTNIWRNCYSPTPNTQDVRQLACNHIQSVVGPLLTGRANLRDLVEGGGWRPVAISVRLLGFHHEPKSDSGKSQTWESMQTTIGQPTQLETLTADVLSGLNVIVIPTAFGLLGTLAGLMRSITAKIRESILAPRDQLVAQIGLCLGMTAGLAVGLFLATTGDATDGASQTAAKTITISSAGLAFLAGFGAETFFTFLDGVIARLLPSYQTPGSSPGK